MPLAELYPHQLLDADQAAEYAGVRPVTIRQWVRRGKLAPAIPGNRNGLGGLRHLYAKPDLDRAAGRAA